MPYLAVLFIVTVSLYVGYWLGIYDQRG